MINAGLKICADVLQHFSEIDLFNFQFYLGPKIQVERRLISMLFHMSLGTVMTKCIDIHINLVACSDVLY